MTDIVLSDTQAAAVREIKDWFLNRTKDQQVFYLAGFGGTGKSTLLKYALDDLNLSAGGLAPSVVTATYTAKAALVLTRFGTPASTIHKLIYIVRRCTETEYEGKRRAIAELEKKAMEAQEDRWILDSALAQKIMELRDMRGLQVTLNDQSQVRDAKLVVIDEVSMCDEKMGKDLLSFGKPILVLGDPGQLPPIRGQGYFTAREPDIMLTEIHRQALDNPIIRLSMMAREGRFIPYGQHGDTVWKLTKRDIEDPAMLLRADQVICGLNRTRFELNNAMRNAKGIEGLLPTSGDKIICLKNDYEKSLINGLFLELDKVEQIDDVRFQAEITTEDGNKAGQPHAKADPFSDDDGIDNGEIEYDPCICYAGHYSDHAIYDKDRDDRDWKHKRNLVESTFGYAISVHKAQGSGFRNVVFWDDGWGAGRPDERKKLVYTAITRAIEGLVIVA